MQKPHTNNDSSNLYYVLSSNTEGAATHIPKHEGGLLHRMLDLLWIKI